ncbi:MAG: helix-turn-helix domain-containing protein [Elainellaceae cyanobacterium]
MAIELTDTSFQELIVQAQQQGESIYQPIDSGVQRNLPKQLGKGSDRILKLRNGLTICIRKGELRQQIRHVLRHESNFPLVAKFYLSGASRVQTLDATDIDDDYTETMGCHYLYHLPNHTEVEEWCVGAPIHVVMVFTDPSYFSTFEIGKTVLSSSLQKLLEGDNAQRFHQSFGQMTPAIRQLLQQLLHCPYTGLMRQLYLESKVMELFAAQFALCAEAPKSPPVALCARDVEQLHQAKEILIQQAIHSPSLTELTWQVGLNDRKLKQGFRHLFGMTIFGYLRDYRIQQAQSLLHQADMAIAQIAIPLFIEQCRALSLR